MELFCNDAAWNRCKTREKQFTLAFRLLAGLTAAAFLLLCLLIRTENARTMLWVMIAVTTVLGWICIGVYLLGVRESRTQRGHLEMLRGGEARILEGRLTLTGESIQIPKSIRIRKVLLDTGAEEAERLNLDEQWVSRMPPDGSRVRFRMVHSYIAGMEITEAAEVPGQKPPGKPGRMRRILGMIAPAGIWALAAVFLCGFVFYQITDTDPAHKITIYMDGEVTNEAQLAARLEKEIGSPVRMVQIHPFRYFMFGSDILKSGDLFIIPDSGLESYREWLVPDEEGTVVCDPETDLTVAGETFLYTAGETYRLYIGALSPHREDGLARRAAELLAKTGNEKEEKK